jgi:large subunit ribosomal protein L3
MEKGILGRKIGMTQVFLPDGAAVPVTVIEAGPCVVVQKKTPAVDGYSAIQVGFGSKREKNFNKPLKGHFARSGVKERRFLKELRLNDITPYEVGQEIKADIFTPGDRCDVTGISKGRGFAGGIKRHGFKRGPMSHGSKYHRRPGSLGAKGPARVFKGRKLPGHYGAERVTVQNLKVVQVDAAKNLLVLKGAVPGVRQGLLLIKSSLEVRGSIGS